MQKILQWGIIVLITITFFTKSDLEQYKRHRIQQNIQISDPHFLETVSVVRSPKSEQWLIEMIDSSRERVWVSVYTFTLPSLRESLLRAKNRGVDVRVILEKFPFGATSINTETKRFFTNSGILFEESQTKDFSFMHAKYMLIDANWMVSTANWTRASFSTNREFFILGRDPEIWQVLKNVFENDFQGLNKGVFTHPKVLIGPTRARESIQNYLDTAEKSIDMYAPSLSDSELLTRLTILCTQQKVIRILVGDYGDEEQEQEKVKVQVQGRNIQHGTNNNQHITINDKPCYELKIMRNPLHAKGIIIDKNSAFIGSFNFTKNSLENNREVGLFVSGEVVDTISQSFESDWKSARVAGN